MDNNKEGLYRLFQVAAKLQEASGQSFANSQIKSLVTKGHIIRVCPPGRSYGVYTRESVDAYCAELRSFYNRYEPAV